MTEIRIGQLDLRDLSTSDLGSANAVANLESNIVSVATTVNAAIDTVSANADTLTTLLNTVSGNIDAAASLVSTISGNADTFASLVTSFASYGNTNFVEGTYIDGEVANLIASAPTALNTLQELATAINNDASFFDTITGLADTVNDNTASIASDIDGIQSNLDSYATYANSQFSASSNISLTVGNTTISNTTIFVEGARSSVYANTNTTSKTLTFTHTMGNATSQEFTMNGSTNALTLGSTATSNTNMYFVFYNGLALKPDEYTISGSTMTLANVDPIISGSNVEVRYLDFFGFRETGSGGGSSASYMIGESTGVTMGGRYYDGSFNYRNTVQHFSLTSSSPSSGPATLSAGEQNVAAGGSSTDAYKFDGSQSTNSERFPFAAFTPRISVGSATTGGWGSVWHNDSKALNPRNQWSFASDASSSPITLTAPGNISMASGESGYRLGSGIYKIPFASDSPSDTGATTVFKHGYGTGLNSPTHGYGAGGNNSESPYAAQDTITKFSFASDGNSTDVGELNNAFGGSANHSTASEGFLSGGGAIVSGGGSTTIQKFSFTSDTSGVAGGVGSLSSAVEVIRQGTQV